MKRSILSTAILLTIVLAGCRAVLPQKAPLPPAVTSTPASTSEGTGVVAPTVTTAPIQPTTSVGASPTTAATQNAAASPTTVTGEIPVTSPTPVESPNATTSQNAAPGGTPMSTPRHLADLPIAFPIQSPQSANYFNQIARPNDIALIPAQGAPRLLPVLSAGQRTVVWASWADAERQFPTIPPGVTIIGYDPEHWAQTPADEQQDLPGTMKRAAAFAHARGLQLLVAPDLRFAQESLSQIAPSADVIVFQGQRLQADPTTFATTMKEFIQTARAANPKIHVFVQVGAPRGSAAQMIGALQGVEGQVDGVVVWTNQQTMGTLQDMVSQLRASTS